MSQQQNVYPLDQHRHRSCFLTYNQPDPHEQLDQPRRLTEFAEAGEYRRTQTEAPPTQAAEPSANREQDQEPTSSRANTGYIDLTTGNETSSSNSSLTEREPTPPSTLAPTRPESTTYTYSQNPLLRSVPELDREIAILRQKMRTDLLLLENSMNRLECAMVNREAAARLDSGSQTEPTTQIDPELEEMWICSRCGRTKDFDSHARCREIFAARLRDQRQRSRGGDRKMDLNSYSSRNQSRSRSPFARRSDHVGGEEDREKEKEKEKETEKETGLGGKVDTDPTMSLSSMVWATHNPYGGFGHPYFP